MKRVFLFAISFFIAISSLYADGKDAKQDEYVHQYLVREAYKLLRLQLGYDVPVLGGGIMHNFVGIDQVGTGPFSPGGYLVIGAYREDMEDLVYGYGNANVPDWLAYHTCTHFWDSDKGDGERWNFWGTMWPNAFEKTNKYLYGDYDVKILTNTGYTEYYRYNNLFDFYKEGNILHKYTYNINGQQTTYNSWVIKDVNFRNKIVWEVLGRMCHLIGDMGTPAHTHHDFHLFDLYEKTAMVNDYIKSNHQDAARAGGIINVVGYTDAYALKYLCYTTNQIAQFFPSDDGAGNNTWG